MAQNFIIETLYWKVKGREGKGRRWLKGPPPQVGALLLPCPQLERILTMTPFNSEAIIHTQYADEVSAL